MIYKDALEKARNVNAKLTAYDFHYCRFVYVQGIEYVLQSCLYESAFMVEYKEWYMVFKEHGVPEVFHHDEYFVVNLMKYQFDVMKDVFRIKS